MTVAWTLRCYISWTATTYVNSFMQRWLKTSQESSRTENPSPYHTPNGGWLVGATTNSGSSRIFFPRNIS